MKIVTVPCRRDNYAYLVICQETMLAAVVDPSQAEPVLEAIEAHAATPIAIWNTHHHYDHVEGNLAIIEKFSECRVCAHVSDADRVPRVVDLLSDGDQVTVGTEVTAHVIHNPGHTRGAVSYYLENSGAVFTGDTLFAAGCGRLFEGSAEQMYQSLKRLASLPESTRVYCGHEYSESNLRFAAHAEPDNLAIGQRLARVTRERAAGQDTMGFTIAEERATNVFVRAQDRVAFSNLRAWKDRF